MLANTIGPGGTALLIVVAVLVVLAVAAALYRTAAGPGSGERRSDFGDRRRRGGHTPD